MPLRFLFLFYILVIHGTLGYLLFNYFEANKWYFLLSELGLFLSLVISYKFYIKFNQPLELMKYGVDAIKDEDYNVRFLKTGSQNINELIEVFNTFLIKLSDEKVSTKEQGYFLESIIKASPTGMIMLDYDDKITSFNESATQLFGNGVLSREKEFFSIEHPLINHIRQLVTGESSIIKINPTQRYRIRVNSIIHLGFKRKFIMIEELSKELLENEKAAYGKVIRMMAHEVNNSMGAVNSILQSVIDFAFDEENSEEANEEYVEILKVAKNRNEELAGFMKNFAEVIRLPPPNKQNINLVELANRGRIIMAATAKNSNISIRVNNVDDAVQINCDSSQIQQVIINALKNAIESISKDGAVTILVQKNQPQLIISDNGPGIQADVQAQLFTPFFSTKPDGQGIGLIISREILVSHGAQFRLYSDPGDGQTHFEVNF